MGDCKKFTIEARTPEEKNSLQCTQTSGNYAHTLLITTGKLKLFLLFICIHAQIISSIFATIAIFYKKT